MKSLLIALLFLLPLTAQAASPEDAYLAARDKAVARIKPKNDKIDDAVTKAADAALAQLQKQLEKLIGTTTIAGVSGKAKINLETLIEGDMGYGQLDGLVYQSGDEMTRVIVTTPTLLKRWIAAHKTWWDDNNIPQETNAALKSEPFYTQALSSDAAVWRYADIPVASGGATYATAMLEKRRQDIGLTTPTELLVTVVRDNRVFVWSAPVAATTIMMPECAEIWNTAQTKADAAYEEYQASDPKDEKKFEASTKILDNADAAYRACFAERVKSEPYFAAIVKQAQELVDRSK